MKIISTLLISSFITVTGLTAQMPVRNLRSLEREYKSLRRDKVGEERSIQYNRKVIKNAQDDMQAANNELAIVNSDLSDFRQYSRLTSGDKQDERTVMAKELEKRKSKAQKAIKTSKNKINRANNKIMKASSNIPKIEKEQDNIQEKLIKQEEVVQKYVNKLSTVNNY